MNTKTDGGPAFPTIESIDNNYTTRRGTIVHDINGQNGMTLRDWFAGMALQGAMANPSTAEFGLKMINEEGFERHHVTIGLVKNAYEYADAMLIAREK